MPLSFDGRTVLFTLSLVVGLPVTAQQAARGGRQGESDVRSARAVYSAVEAGIAANRLQTRDTTVQCDGDRLEFEVTLHTDSAGVVRRLRWQGGSDDSAADTRYYYDAGGRLRFAFAKRGAVNGTQEEERVWYSPSGRVARRDRRLLDGPGYPFAELEVIRTPLDWLRRACR